VLCRWVGKIIVREARGFGIESCGVGHLVPVLPPGTKAPESLDKAEKNDQSGVGGGGGVRVAGVALTRDRETHG